MDTTTERTPLLSNRAYDVAKYIATIFLPAAGALYFGLAQIWGLPNAEQVVGTVAVIDTFLGTVLLLSTKQYNNSDAKYDGALLVDSSSEEKDVYTFEVTSPLEDLRNKKELTLKVENPN